MSFLFFWRRGPLSAPASLRFILRTTPRRRHTDGSKRTEGFKNRAARAEASGVAESGGIPPVPGRCSGAAPQKAEALPDGGPRNAQLVSKVRGEDQPTDKPAFAAGIAAFPRAQRDAKARAGLRRNPAPGAGGKAGAGISGANPGSMCLIIIHIGLYD